jgi:hypothetical protein
MLRRRPRSRRQSTGPTLTPFREGRGESLPSRRLHSGRVNRVAEFVQSSCQECSPGTSDFGTPPAQTTYRYEAAPGWHDDSASNTRVRSRHRFCGHVFQGRYRTELVEDETYCLVNRDLRSWSPGFSRSSPPKGGTPTDQSTVDSPLPLDGHAVRAPQPGPRPFGGASRGLAVVELSGLCPSGSPTGVGGLRRVAGVVAGGVWWFGCGCGGYVPAVCDHGRGRAARVALVGRVPELGPREWCVRRSRTGEWCGANPQSGGSGGGRRG